MRATLMILLSLLLTISISCGGGGSSPGPDPSSGIQGPNSVTEGSSTQFTIERKANTSATYQWTINPASLGSFSAPKEAETHFIAGDVSIDTPVELAVAVALPGGAPVIATHSVTIKNKPPPGGNPVGEKPVAMAHAEPPSVNPGGYVRFVDDSTDPDGNDDIVNWEWDFSYVATEGFKGEIFDKEPYIQFPTIGTYTIQLRVTDKAGNMDLLDQPITVSVSSGVLKPIAKASAFPVPSTPCEPIQFQDNGSFPQSGTSIVKYEWDWENDGVFDEQGLFAFHTWIVAGTYEVQFQVTDNTGLVASLDEPIEIIIENSLPWANVLVSDLNPTANEGVAFDASTSIDADCGDGIQLYEWDWENDGIWDDTGVNLFKVFEYPGTFEVMLRVTDDESDIDLLDEPLIITVQPGYATTWGGTGSDTSHGIAIDSGDSMYVTGSFSGTVDFDTGPGVDERTATSSSNAYLIKFSPDAEYMWVTTWGDEEYSTGLDIYVSTPGFIYVVGTTTLIKFNQLGDILWEYDNNWIGQGIYIDDYTGVFLAGHFIPSGQSFEDSFLTCLNYDGTTKWERTWGGAGSDVVNDVCTDANGDLFLTGHFESTVDFDPSSAQEIRTAEILTDSFLTKYNQDGDFQWVRSWEATDSLSIDVDQGNRIYVTGYYEDTTDFDPGPEEVSYPGTLGYYLSRFNPFGELVWAQAWYQWSEPQEWGGWDLSYGVMTDNTGNVYVAGSFEDDVDFDPGSGSETYYNGGAFITQFIDNGEYQRTKVWGTHHQTGWDAASSIALDSDGNLIVAGGFGGSCDFGMEKDEKHNSVGEDDAYILRIPTGIMW